MKRSSYPYRLLLWLVLNLAAGSGFGATFVVDSPADSHDANPGDGLAADHANPDLSRTTLRAAIEEANALDGADTVLIPIAHSPIELRLGALLVTDNQTHVLGQSGYPVIEGVYNVINHATFMLFSDSNSIAGLQVRRSRGDAIDIFGAHNRVGGSTTVERVIIVGGGWDNTSASAIRISGPDATDNVVRGSHLGLESNGMTSNGNRRGVTLEYAAARNWVGGPNPEDRNLIAGNDSYGLLLTTGAFDNNVAGNYIGADSSGRSGPGNGSAGILLNKRAHDNFIGGDDLTQGNLISANRGDGIRLSGPDVTENTITGNLIGSSMTGREYLGNAGDGIHLTDGANTNLIGGSGEDSGNLIGGNSGNGICLSGPDVAHNLIKANWIGIALSGTRYLSNGWIAGDGIRIEAGAHNNIIGGTVYEELNICSGNYGFGVHLRGQGTDGNVVVGNVIGLNWTGTSSIGNGCGVVISDGAQYNTIGGPDIDYGNLISSNRSLDFPFGAGVLIYGPGTNFNRVSANYIGLDISGLRARPNRSAGIIVGHGAQHNTIGGDNLTDGNTISGNGSDDPVPGVAAGIHIYGRDTRFNLVQGNHIGVGPDGSTVIPNNGHGIGLVAGASYNWIGGDGFREANKIWGNEGAGVFLSGTDTQANLIRRNSMNDNAGLGIEIRDSAQGGIWPPTITTVGQLLAPGARHVVGRDAPPGVTIDIYDVQTPDSSGAGEGYSYLASTTATSSGNFDFYLPYAAATPIILTAIAVDGERNSSAFAINGYSPDAANSAGDTRMVPYTFRLDRNYPNPFNPKTTIGFELPAPSWVRLSILNILGQRVRSLVDRELPVGPHTVVWNGRDEHGDPVASGVYFYRLETADRSATRKLVLLK